jgi:hypothetical protein
MPALLAQDTERLARCQLVEVLQAPHYRPPMDEVY